MRRFLLFCLIFLMLFAAGSLWAYQYRITLAHKAIDYVSKELGFEENRLKISKLHMAGAEINDIWLGPDLSLATLRVGYSLSGLLKGEIDQVFIEGLSVDISNPNKDALGKIQNLMGGSDQTTSPAMPRLPEIIITDMHIYGQNQGVNLDFTVNGKVHPDSSGIFSANGKARYESMLMDDVSLSATLIEQAKTVSINLQSATLQDQNTPALFAPLKLLGALTYQENKIDLSAHIQDQGERLNINMKGTGDLINRSAQLKFTIPEFKFSKDGFQPGDLSALAALPYPLNSRLSVTGDALWKDNTPTVHADIDFKDMQVDFDQPDLSRLKMEGTVRLDALPLTQQAMFSIQNLKVQQPALFNPLHVEAQGKLKDNQITGEMTTFLDTKTKQKVLTIKASHDLNHETGQALISTPDLTFSQTGLSLSLFTPLLEAVQKTTGKIHLTSPLSWDKGGLTSKAVVQLSDLSLQTNTVSLNQINSNLSFSNLNPLQTKKSQTIDLESLSSGVTLYNPHLVFRLKNAQALIEEFNASFIGGRISVKDFLLNPEAKQHDVTLNLAHLDLEKLFNLIQLDGLDGTGHVTGKIPLTISGENIVITNGTLISDAPGTLYFNSEKASQALAGAGDQVDLLLRVLSDFHYEKLSLKINREPSNNAIVNLHIEGKNPAVMDSRPFNLNINLEGNIDPLLKTIMEGYRLSERAIQDTVGERH
ncbi:MAG: YdbH domain-containing protein [Methylocystaceae bacterium]|nr:YdbH domain-containing protein [Methylocystaceae bacterium]